MMSYSLRETTPSVVNGETTAKVPRMKTNSLLFIVRCLACSVWSVCNNLRADGPWNHTQADQLIPSALPVVMNAKQQVQQPETWRLQFQCWWWWFYLWTVTPQLFSTTIFHKYFILCRTGIWDPIYPPRVWFHPFFIRNFTSIIFSIISSIIGTWDLGLGTGDLGHSQVSLSSELQVPALGGHHNSVILGRDWFDFGSSDKYTKRKEDIS